MGKTKKSEKLKWSIDKSGNFQRNRHSSYSIIPASEVTQASVEVWATLPVEIRQDPSLVSFRQEHERIHGENHPEERDPSLSDEDAHVHDGVISKARANQPKIEKTAIDMLNDTGGQYGDSDNKTTVSRRAAVSSHEAEEHEHEHNGEAGQSMFKNARMAFFVAVWILITGILMSKEEKVHTFKQISIPVNGTRTYEVNSRPIGAQLGVFVHGAFDKDDTNTSDNFFSIRLEVWNSEFKVPHGDQNLSTSDSIEHIGIDQIEYRVPIVGNIDQIDFVQDITKSLVIDVKESMLHHIDDGQMEFRLRLRTNLPINFAVRLAYDTTPIDKSVGVIYAAVILLCLYVLIIWEIVHRTFAAMIASATSIAVLALMNERPTMPEVVSWIDVETMLLLFGMMVLVAILSETGVFDYSAVYAYKITNGRIWPLINCLCLFTALLSSFLDNVTTVLLMTPVTIRLCEVMQLNPVPILMSMILFTNIGGTLTPVGDPPNVLIATNAFIIKNGIDFMTFTLHMSTGVVLIMIQSYLQLRFIYRNLSDLRFGEPQDIQELRRQTSVWKHAAASLSSYSKDEVLVRESLLKKANGLSRQLKRKLATGSLSSETYRHTLDELKKKYHIRNRPLLIKSVVVLIFVIGFFFLHSIPNIQRLSLGWTALLGAVLLLILADRQDMEAVLARVEWSTLLFFAALLVLMEALSVLGLIDWIGSQTENVILAVDEEHRLTVAILIILWVSAIASAFVDNIPLTTMMLKVTISLAEKESLSLPLQPLVWALAIGACIGGNGTLIGASANIICAGVAEQHGYRFTFIEYFRVGFPIMIGSMIVATIYLLTAHVLFAWH